MPYYLVNQNAQPTGEHEVHEKNNCNHLPEPHNRKDLGWHLNCNDAIKEAKKTYNNVDGCKYCVPQCHTR